MGKTSNLLVGFIAGAAVGAVLGVLYAPAKGSRTRQSIREDAGELGERTREAVTERIDGIRREASGFFGKLRARLERLEEELDKELPNEPDTSQDERDTDYD